MISRRKRFLCRPCLPTTREDKGFGRERARREIFSGDGGGNSSLSDSVLHEGGVLGERGKSGRNSRGAKRS